MKFDPKLVQHPAAIAAAANEDMKHVLKIFERMDEMPESRIFEFSYTPLCWELGIGFYFGKTYTSLFTGIVTKKPMSAWFCFLPFTLAINFGYEKHIRPKIIIAGDIHGNVQ